MSGRPAGTVALQLRQWGAFRGALIALAVVVLLATFAVTAWPRAVTQVQTDDLRFRVGQQPAQLTTVQTHVHQQGMSPGSAGMLSYLGDFVWDDLGPVLRHAHAGMPQPLRSVLTAPQWAQRTSEMATTGPRANYHYQVQLEVFPGLRSESRLVAGRWPAPYQAKLDPALPAGTVGPMLTTTTPIEIVLSADTAKKMGWAIGQTHPIAPAGGQLPVQRVVRLVGTIAPRENSADFWSMDTLRDQPSLVEICPGGLCTGQFNFTAVAWLDPAPWSQMQYSFTADTTGWYGADPARLTSSNVATVQRQLNTFLASPPTGGIPLHFSTELTGILDTFAASSGSTQTLLLLLAVGPLGVAIAVLVLGSELLVSRRRHVLALLSARGASAMRIRGALAVEGTIVAVPTAALATVAAVVLFPPSRGAPLNATTIVLALCCAALPPLILAALGRTGTAPGRPRGRGRMRWVAEAMVVLAAVVAVAVLFQRGLVPPATGAADPLLVLAPLLIALAVCALVLRLYPIPLHWLAAALHRSRGAVGAIGAARSRGSISDALIPVLAVLVAVAITIFSVVAFQTERAGIAQAAVGTVGADVSLTDQSLTASTIARARAVEGVQQLVPVKSAGYAALTKDGNVEAVLVLVADTAALAEVQSALPAAARVPDGMSHRSDGRLPLVLGNWPDDGTATAATFTTNRDLPARVVSSSAPIGSAGDGAPWVLIDQRLVPGGLQSPHLVSALMTLKPGADAGTVVHGLRAIGGSDAVVDDAIAAQRQIRSAPVVGGLEFALLAAAGFGAVLAVLALVLMLVMSAAARVRLTATLRTVGFSTRQTTWLIAWEIAPIVVAGLIGGMIVGMLLPSIVLAPLDLRAFTGGVQPALTADGLTIAAFVAGFVVLLAAIIAVTLWSAARRNPAGVLRTGEDE